MRRHLFSELDLSVILNLVHKESEISQIKRRKNKINNEIKQPVGSFENIKVCNNRKSHLSKKLKNKYMPVSARSSWIIRYTTACFSLNVQSRKYLYWLYTDKLSLLLSREKIDNQKSLNERERKKFTKKMLEIGKEVKMILRNLKTSPHLPKSSKKQTTSHGSPMNTLQP